MKLFITAFLQVFLVAANTYFISKVFWPGIAIAGFGISFLWTANVRRVAIGGMRDRFIYATGAMAGGLAGVLISKLII